MKSSPKVSGRSRSRSWGRLIHSLVLAPGLLALGCASTSPEPAFRDMASEVESRSGQKLAWRQAGDDSAKLDKNIDDLLKQPLGADDAVTIALLANPRLRVAFEDLALAQGDVAQAARLSNPTLSVGMTAWEQEHIQPNFFVSVEQSFLDLVMLPLRKRAARSMLEAEKLHVADQVLEVAGQVRKAYFDALATEQIVAMRRIVLEASEASADLAKRQHVAGAGTELARRSEEALASEVRVALAESEQEAAAARERLVRVLGLFGRRTHFRLAPRLPPLPATDPSPEKLERVAMENRLDLSAARQEIAALEDALSASKTSRWTGFVNVHVEAARRRGDRAIVFGPSASIELPIFDQRQAAIARLESMKRASEARLSALAIEIRSEVREDAAALETSRRRATELRDVLVPSRERIVALTMQRYNAMLSGVYELLAARRAELEAYQHYLLAVRDYWTARGALERAVAVRLDTLPTSEAPPAEQAHP
jgi:outer membrane protein, heavy metal efflux system